MFCFYHSYVDKTTILLSPSLHPFICEHLHLRKHMSDAYINFVLYYCYCRGY